MIVADAFAKLQKLLIIARVVMEKHVGNEEKWGGEWGICVQFTIHYML